MIEDIIYALGFFAILLLGSLLLDAVAAAGSLRELLAWM